VIKAAQLTARSSRIAAGYGQKGQAIMPDRPDIDNIRLGRTASSIRRQVACATAPGGGDTEAVITLELAQQLRAKGLEWRPVPGDRFVLPNRGMDDQVFVISDMTIQVQDLPTGRVIGFNGTTEWALDSVQQADVVWLPRESQLRELLGDSFLGLHAVPSGYAVVIERDGQHERRVDGDCEQAYARSLLSLLDQ
jgi:hypothetical protein